MNACNLFGNKRFSFEYLFVSRGSLEPFDTKSVLITAWVSNSRQIKEHRFKFHKMFLVNKIQLIYRRIK